ncbi:MAG: tetratricopeptide repeat protein [Acidobacteriales bacterium]|nr:tetratricopeptide repeat protein [Terriglobales bacterium]
MFSRLFALILVLCLVIAASAMPQTEIADSEQLQVNPPTVRRIPPPDRNLPADQLEQRADQLRSQKLYVDALDYYHAALSKKPDSGVLYNKMGITELLSQRLREAARDFEHAIKYDNKLADAANNLGVIDYLQKKYGRAIKEYKRAIELHPDSASFYSNLGAAYFSRKDFVQASDAYAKAVQLDPEIFDRISRTGVSAQMSSPEDRAHYDYVVAKLFAKMGRTERSLEYLRRAMEEGYKGVEDVYKDPEFASLRKDERFTKLMAARPLAIPQ